MDLAINYEFSTLQSLTLTDCTAFSDDSRIGLIENLCHGDDDLGLRCWGPPSFSGWQK